MKNSLLVKTGQHLFFLVYAAGLAAAVLASRHGVPFQITPPRAETVPAAVPPGPVPAQTAGEAMLPAPESAPLSAEIPAETPLEEAPLSGLLPEDAGPEPQLPPEAVPAETFTGDAPPPASSRAAHGRE